MCVFFPKSAPVGLRLPDCTHIYSNKGFSYFIYNLYREEEWSREKERREENCSPHPLIPNKEKRNSTTGRYIYVPSIMEECAPQTEGSAQANVLLVFLGDLF